MSYSMDFKIGIIGGGQLGKMLAQAAKKLNFHVSVLDPTPQCPAYSLVDNQIVAGFYDDDKIRELVENSDITTFEIEHISTKVLKQLQDMGHKIYPSPEVLEIIQDKAKQKQMLDKHGIPTARWTLVEGNIAETARKFGMPTVQKARKGGYDGRGVFVIRSPKDIEHALQCESFLEELVPVEKELAVMVARSINGEIKCYPVVEMTFDSRANICDDTVAPARIEENIKKEAEDLAIRCVKALDGVGIFGVEMFLTKDKRVLVNEIAPRPHNSGHYTIEACVTSQFEQHLRAITGLPLGSTELIMPAVMVNLLGAEGYQGKPYFEGVNEILKIPGVSLHIYGKKETKPFRKMGHVTIVDKRLEDALDKAKIVKQTIKVISEG
ncbi:5-(carboxyamino)imidazole ribonucleotide synthase [Tepidanaerobacter sp. GT38]|uniref:5-(carboxyamino)imidazole ribonucleotide synthase n=1 Tax=Tepidanaerobacter sp. GT38 TaxID=2722793 RepID=UPI001F005FE9|nr:5-(carboxyamino)imidazole ribonucleotide synthase [Tepidanaerobacter sp. GT38]MCG1010981.1 5-(carboxyamino)imidazole ribonucleotide synthase [Tepidanaerobacter sp. GT38]